MRRVPKQDFADKVAIVTGGASGLGRGLCEQLARRGAKLVIADIDVPRALALADELTRAGCQAESQRVDVTDAASVDALVAATVERHGRIDYMFNNAGIAAAGEFQDVSAEVMKRVIDINLLGSAYGTLAAYRQMVKQRRGQIVNIASMYALFPNPLSVAYVAAKHGLGGLTQAVRIEAAGYGVDLTLICPGYIETNLFASGSYASKMDAEQVRTRIPFKLLDIDSAVNATLRAVLAKKPIAVFPAYARAMWLLQRISPRFLAWLSKLVLADQRKRFPPG